MCISHQRANRKVFKSQTIHTIYRQWITPKNTVDKNLDNLWISGNPFQVRKKQI